MIGCVLHFLVHGFRKFQSLQKLKKLVLQYDLCISNDYSVWMYRRTIFICLFSGWSQKCDTQVEQKWKESNMIIHNIEGEYLH